MTRGVLVTLEGIDGCGKSTIMPTLASYIRSEGHELVVTKEPGGGQKGQVIRDLLFKDPGASKLHTGQVDCLLLFDHIGHVEGLIRPALASGKWVLCDRYADSQFAYSAGAPEGRSKHINEAFAKHYGPVPDVTFLLIGNPEICGARAKGRDLQPDALEPGKQQGKIWANVRQQQRIQDAYLQQLSNQPRTVIINVNGLSAVDVATLALMGLRERLSRFHVLPAQAALFESVQ